MAGYGVPSGAGRPSQEEIDQRVAELQAAGQLGVSNVQASTPSSSGSLETELAGLSDRYQNNMDFEVEQAQNQMNYQTSANKIAMDFSAAQAELAYQRQLELRQTAYQDTVKDLKAAGLNPILAYSQGASSTPSVSSASGVTSAGSKADLADIGYDLADLYVKIFQSELSSSTEIKKSVINGISGIIGMAAKAAIG